MDVFFNVAVNVFPWPISGVIRLWPLSNDDQNRESSVSTIHSISHNTNDVKRAKNHHGNGSIVPHHGNGSIVPLEATNVALSFASSTPSYRFWNAPMVKSPRPLMTSSLTSYESTRTDQLNTSDVATKASQVKHVKRRPWFPWLHLSLPLATILLFATRYNNCVRLEFGTCIAHWHFNIRTKLRIVIK